MCHTAEDTLDVLRSVFEDRIISRSIIYAIKFMYLKINLKLKIQDTIHRFSSATFSVYEYMWYSKKDSKAIINIHTYIHNWSLQPQSGLFTQFLTPITLSVLIFVHTWRDLQFKDDSDRFFKKLFMAILFSIRVFARNLLRGYRRRNTFCTGSAKYLFLETIEYFLKFLFFI